MGSLTDRAKKFLENKREQQPPPFTIGDYLSYQVPGDPKEGPFQVAEIAQDLRHCGWWALVEKPDSLAWVHQKIVTRGSTEA